MLGVHQGGVACTDAEESGVELIDRRQDTTAPYEIGIVTHTLRDAGGIKGGVIKIDEAIFTCRDPRPKFVGTVSPGEPPGHPDYRDIGFVVVRG